jgi:asparagine synthase (glutamine-hydrolysing)
VDLAGDTSPWRPPTSVSDRIQRRMHNHLAIRAELEARGRVFRTRSDTEVILHAYAEYVLRLRGEALGDVRAGHLGTRASDVPSWPGTAGIKPPLRDPRRHLALPATATFRVPGLSPSLDRESCGVILIFRSVPPPPTLFDVGCGAPRAGHHDRGRGKGMGSRSASVPITLAPLPSGARRIWPRSSRSL